MKIKIENAIASKSEWSMVINGKYVYGLYIKQDGKPFFYDRDDDESLSGEETIAIRDWLDKNG